MAQGCYWFTKISGLGTARASRFRFGALEFQGLRIRTLSACFVHTSETEPQTLKPNPKPETLNPKTLKP